MKNLTKLIVSIVIIAIIALSFNACDKENGDKTVPTKFRFRNQTPPTNLPARSVEIMGGATIDTASYATYIGSTYTTNANIIQGNITPDTFKAYDGTIMAYISEWSQWFNLTDSVGTNLIDFKQGITITMPDDIPEGITATAMLVYCNFSAPPGLAEPTTTFTVTTAIHADHQWKTNAATWGITFSNDDKTITVPTSRLFPQQLIEPRFLYTGTVYKYASSFELYPSMNGFITPWNGYSTTGKSSITFNVNWDLNGIIEQRCASSGAGHACADCRYVLANEFWKRFSFTVD